jgi:DNA-binding NarL/FixJ family response regulator
MRIFVLDDHPLMREAVVMLIRRLSSKASVIELDRLAAIGPALEQHGMPDFICLDLKLPDTHGVSGVRELRHQFPEVPIVVLSAAPAQDYRNCHSKPVPTCMSKNQPAPPKSPKS